jgi:hypothetical protein
MRVTDSCPAAPPRTPPDPRLSDAASAGSHLRCDSRGSLLGRTGPVPRPVPAAGHAERTAPAAGRGHRRRPTHSQEAVALPGVGNVTARFLADAGPCLGDAGTAWWEAGQGFRPLGAAEPVIWARGSAWRPGHQGGVREGDCGWVRRLWRCDEPWRRDEMHAEIEPVCSACSTCMTTSRTRWPAWTCRVSRGRLHPDRCEPARMRVARGVRSTGLARRTPAAARLPQ